VARFLGALPEEIVFTSGGTEANNLAIGGLAAAAAARGRHRIVTSALEHPSVRGMVDALVGGAGSATSTLVPVTPTGAISVGALQAALGEGPDCGVVTLALANHELGNVYPIASLAAAGRAHGALVHTDVVQAAGKMRVDVGALGVDAATVSAHKLGGPKGIGAVFIRRGLDLPPRLMGGHQERERRPGTENLVGAIGFGVACTVAASALEDEARRFQSMRRTLVAGLARIPGAVLLGCAADGEGLRAVEADDAPAEFLPGTTMVAFREAPGQLVVIGLDLEGVCVSTGAACSSGSLEPSPVLLGLGLGRDAAAEGVRISFGWTTSTQDVERLCAVLPAIVGRVREAVAAPAAATARREVHG
jgi:cysteine desulfurase